MNRRINFLMDREMRKFRFGWAIIYRDWDRVEIFKSQNAACERWDGYEVPCLDVSWGERFLADSERAKKKLQKKEGSETSWDGKEKEKENNCFNRHGLRE